ncbi:MAG: hypothetical protein Q4D93_05480 [Porphyromonas sp.]|nr:hypothetical protein [Porphyromonas sp.]
MNNKSFYAIIAFIALIELFMVRGDYPIVTLIAKIFICGGSFYYILTQYQRRRRVTALMVLMAVVGVLYNPVLPILLPISVNILMSIVVAGLFYLVAKSTPIEEGMGIGRSHSDDEE